MKKYLIFCILSLIFIFSLLPLPAEAVKKIDANPINVAYVLSQKTDSDDIASTLRYYGYNLSSENGHSTQSASAGLSSAETFCLLSRTSVSPLLSLQVNAKKDVSSRIDILTNFAVQTYHSV